jgi:drug/metabolite transporter (DMT)-like permease
VGDLFFSNKISKTQLWGMLLAFSGSILLILAKNQGSLNLSVNPWALLIVLATVMYGFNVNILKTHLSHLTPMLLTACMLTTIGPIAGLMLVNSNFSEIAFLPSSKEALTYTVLLGVLGTGLATILFNWLLQITSPVFSSSVTYLVPIVAIFWGILDNEVLFLQHYIGIILTLFGVYWVNKSN